MKNSNYIEIEFKEVNYLLNGELILIITATDLETSAVHQRIKPLNGHDKIFQSFEGDLTYYFGVLGKYKIAQVQCSSMGSISRGSSIMTVSTALQKLKSRIVIMIGIAFGVDEKKQNIGDVLVSESIVPYNAKRIGKNATILRAIEAPCSKVLLNRFKNIVLTWEHFLNNNIKASLITTRLLSGEELVDNIEHRDSLINDFPDSKGGEMEGAGLYAACDGKADWIVVKGICDFADGEKGNDKEFKQITAINSALSACMEIFNSDHAFKELKVLPIDEFKKNDGFNIHVNINGPLFDIYDANKKKFYIERAIDKSFNKVISQFGVWIYGPPGCGKSNLIIRNLIENKKEFIQVSLAACIGLEIETFFKEILYEVASKVEGITSQIQPKNFSECNKALLDLLNTHYNDKDLIIFIEEIPISSEENYKEFSGKIFSLLISKNLTEGLNKIRFVLSSINNPINHIQIFQQKIHQQLNFLSLEYWSKEEILPLIELIEKELEFFLPLEIKNELLTTGSPRFIKKFFRSIYSLDKKDEATLKYILKETQRELSQYSHV